MKKTTTTVDFDAFADSDDVPVAIIARRENTTPRHVRDRSNTDPTFPPLISFNSWERARKFINVGAYRRWRATVEEAARERQAKRVARNAEHEHA